MTHPVLVRWAVGAPPRMGDGAVAGAAGWPICEMSSVPSSSPRGRSFTTCASGWGDPYFAFGNVYAHSVLDLADNIFGQAAAANGVQEAALNMEGLLVGPVIRLSEYGATPCRSRIAAAIADPQ